MIGTQTKCDIFNIHKIKNVCAYMLAKVLCLEARYVLKCLIKKYTACVKYYITFAR